MNAAAFAQITEWWTDLGDKPGGDTGHPYLHFGGLASGDAVIESIENSYFASVLNNDPWLRASDMEGAGLALAVRHLKESGYLTGFMVVRGISDTPAGVGEEGANRETRKHWTNYASSAAAHFLAQFIKHAFPYSPAISNERFPQATDAPAKKHLDADMFASYQSHFVRADELSVIHSINDTTYDHSVLVPEATLEMWWRVNPLSIRLISTIRSEVVGYWQILLLSPQAFWDLLEGRLTEKQLRSPDILAYQELKVGSVYVYVTAVSVLGSMQARSASVVLDMIVFLRLLHNTIGINGISAQAVSNDSLNLIASFGMTIVNIGSPISTWVLGSREKINRAMQTAQRHLTRLRGLIPKVTPEEHYSFTQILRR